MSFRFHALVYSGVMGINSSVRLLFGTGLTVVLLVGCTDGKAQPPMDSPPSGVAEIPWPYWPAAMRVHPLTRIVPADAEHSARSAILEARLEFLDVDRNTCKAVGRVRLDLSTGVGSNERITPEDSGFTWQVNLADRDVNHQLYDEVTRTYQFRLEVPHALLKGDAPLTLFAYYLGHNGTNLNAHMRIK